MKRLITGLAAAILLTGISGVARGQTIVFTDDFSTNTNDTYTTSGAIGASSWSVTRSGPDWGARRNTSPAQLELTNDAIGTTNAAGWIFSSTSTASFSSPYNTTLSSNSGLVTWTFNMRQLRTDPAGFSSVSSYGVAFVLGGTSTSINTAGTGYAVVLGQSGSTDSIRLAKYNNGLQGTLTNIITSNTTGLADFGVGYISVKVTYNPSNNQWELFLRNDGATAFADPASGTLVSQGTATDNTYTGTALTELGGYWQGSTVANQTAFFDNVSVTVVSAGTPTISVTPSSLSGFSYIEGNGPSAEQSFSLSGSNLTDKISITPPTNYEISRGTGGSFSATNPITLTQSGGTVVATTIYVRLKSGLSAGSYNSETITATSTGATEKTVTCSGTVSELPNIWINEFHYDNAGADTLEFVEIVVPADFSDLSGVTLTLYNGDGGKKYGSNKLDEFNTNGNTYWNFKIYYKDISGIQNGPDGFSLDYNGSVIQFLSYGGTFQANDGPANGMTSTDVSVAENNSTTLVGHSLQLLGSGTQYSDFTWYGPFENTKGLPNSGDGQGQSLSVPVATFTAEENATITAGKFTIKPCYPNPFNPVTHLDFTTPEAMCVSVKIYDMRGRLVRTLADENFSDGAHQLTWDGTDDGRRTVSNGVYFYRVQTNGKFSRTDKIVFMR